MKKALFALFILAALAALIIPFLPANLPAQQRDAQKLKVFISADMEGITGVVASEQTTPGNPEYAAARKWMAEDVNAAVEGALRAGATEVVVNDSHGSQRNIDPGDIHPKAILISGYPKPLSMMQGIDESYNAVLFIGYHAGAGTQDAVLDHTISGSVVQSVKVNGMELPELGLNAAIAGAYNVPVVFISGDVAVCRQAKTILGGDVVTAPVKDGIGRTAARLVPFAEARRGIRDRVTDALRKLGQVKPFKIAAPCRFELMFYISAQADMAMYFPNVQRVNSRTVAFTSDDYLKGFKTLRGMIAIAPGR
ncbi:MAG: M55 family metallopeptidase [Candidatus Aminicenantales bacterium]